MNEASHDNRLSFDFDPLHNKLSLKMVDPDWSKIGGVELELVNKLASENRISGQIHAKPGSGRYDSALAESVLAPGEHCKVIFPLPVPFMRQPPPLLDTEDARMMFETEGQYGEVNTKEITSFEVFANQPLSSFELIGARTLPATSLHAIVDKFGLYSRSSWPHKLNSTQELKSRRGREIVWLQQHHRSADFDQFGGWAGGPTLSPSGFFRCALVTSGHEVTQASENAKWWLVTPEGHLFWSLGINCVEPAASGPVEKRESLFAWLPPKKGNKFSAHWLKTWAGGEFDFYGTNLQRKFGLDWRRQWSSLAESRLSSWGFNTIGNWSDADLCSRSHIPYVKAIYYDPVPKIGNTDVPDFFSQQFPVSIDRGVSHDVKDTCRDKFCIGYFIDNEINWDNWGQDDTVAARACLALGADSAARANFVDRLRRKYATEKKWCQAWNVSTKSWMAPLVIEAKDLNQAAREDCRQFLSELAENYYANVEKSLKKYAPDQLYLGSRLASRPDSVVQAAERHCDVLSFNVYDFSLRVPMSASKPFLVSEFSFGSTDRGMFHPGLCPCPDQNARGDAYRSFVLSAMATKNCVGCHWFRYIDDPVTGRFDGENFNVGLVDVTDSQFDELIESVRSTNLQIYTAR